MSGSFFSLDSTLHYTSSYEMEYEIEKKNEQDKGQITSLLIIDYKQDRIDIHNRNNNNHNKKNTYMTGLFVCFFILSENLYYSF